MKKANVNAIAIFPFFSILNYLLLACQHLRSLRPTDHHSFKATNSFINLSHFFFHSQLNRRDFEKNRRSFIWNTFPNKTRYKMKYPDTNIFDWNRYFPLNQSETALIIDWLECVCVSFIAKVSKSVCSVYICIYNLFLVVLNAIYSVPVSLSHNRFTVRFIYY